MSSLIEYTILNNCAKTPTSWKWNHKYRHIAILEHDAGYTPRRIDTRLKGVRRIMDEWYRVHSGSTDRCAVARVLAQARDLVAKYETRLLVIQLAKMAGYHHVPQAQTSKLSIALRAPSSDLILLYSWDGRVREGVALAMPTDLRDRFGRWEHGATRAVCRAEIARKRAVVADERRTAQRTQRQSRAISLILALCPQLHVTYADARAAGLCDLGVRGFCADHQVDVNMGWTAHEIRATNDARALPAIRKAAERVAAQVTR